MTPAGLSRGATGKVSETANDAKDKVDEKASNVTDMAGEKAGIEIHKSATSVVSKVVDMFEGLFTVADDGHIRNQNGNILGKLAKGQNLQDLVDKEIKSIILDNVFNTKQDTIILL
ncbi:hypothetical protein PG990_014670 [Apiospora arundinis]